ncbi:MULTISPECIES: hypothetical protein [unclassified Cryobacterium]|uniref:hypothetical protein n=1 Tax=unclassified Cryobacterium TaxID=2649013 RepID=UPI00106D65DD|nr:MULTISPECIES: hypothetical protein [unclassified Cryobacterium]TFC57459.1 hypothetical protein E3O60_15405 [Cryobacterium sp. TMB1-7]TFC89981.1 hypothetical protein E3T19_06760 [Cryobacterium sp. TMT4-31]
MLDSPPRPGIGGASRNTSSVETTEDAANSVTDAANLAYTLSSELESVVRAVPGVDSLYPTEPVVATIVGAIVDALTHRERTSNLVAVTMGDAGINVSVAFRAVSSEPATEVCRLVFDSIAMVLDASSITRIDSIHVTVASIG